MKTKKLMKHQGMLGWREHEKSVFNQNRKCYEETSSINAPMRKRANASLSTSMFGRRDDSFGSCETLCVEYEGTIDVLGVKAIASWARASSQPNPTIRNDGDHSTVKVVRQTRDELQIEMQPVTPTVLKGSNGWLNQANKATKGMMSSLETRRVANQLCKRMIDTRFGCGNVSNQARMAWAGTIVSTRGGTSCPSGDME